MSNPIFKEVLVIDMHLQSATLTPAQIAERTELTEQTVKRIIKQYLDGLVVNFEEI